MIKHIFITGISSGIGKACVERAIEKGWVVSGCARNKEALDRLQERFGDNIVCSVADVGDQEQLHQAVKNGLERFGKLHAVVANAGRGVDGELLELSDDEITAVFDTNVVGVHRTIRACEQYLEEKSAIILVASVASFLSIPRMGAYCATKHALDAYAAALRMELKSRKIAVMTMNPGTVSTNFFEAAPKPGSIWEWRPGSSLTARQVAKGIINQAMNRKPRRIVTPWFARLAAFMYRAWPSLGEWVMRRQLEKMRAQQVDMSRSATIDVDAVEDSKTE